MIQSTFSGNWKKIVVNPINGICASLFAILLITPGAKKP
jgi:hypothetical protein